MSACGFAATSTTMLIFNRPPDLLLATLIALAAMLDYHLQWLNPTNLKEVWKSYTSKYKYWLALAFIVAFAFLYILDIAQLLFLGHLCILALAYGYGLSLGSLKIPPLRNINYLKIFLIVYVWVALTVCLPLIGAAVSLKAIALESVQRAFFYLALTLPFDIRDERSDKEQKLKTLANKLGTVKTKWLSAICLGLPYLLIFVTNGAIKNKNSKP